jgi:phosphoglycerate dehydrogenase-like enzyme
MASFRVALSGDFIKADGTPAYVDFDLGPLRSDSRIDMAYIPADNPLSAAALEDFDALILLIPRFARASVPGSGRLAVVARFGVGYDTVDVQACSNNGIALVTTPDGVRRPVAVSIMAFMLALTGRMLAKDRIVRRGPEAWAERGATMGMGLTGRTLGVLGMGNIGAELFRLAKPFEMRFIAHDPYADAKVAADLGVRLVALEELFSEADILSVNCPLNDETRHIVNGARLALMKPTAWLINTARGPVVDEKALTRVLQERRIAGAGLDVFEIEPTPADNPLLALDNVILAPHALCWTDECFRGIGAAAVKAVLEVMQGRVPRGIVNRDIVDHPGWKAKLDGYGRAFAGR